jgi:predicted transcriptional regulator
MGFLWLQNTCGRQTTWRNRGHDKASQILRGLGLTEAEAETYFTALQTCKNEPLSSYKLAQTMGRDPANVAKTLAALVRLQAMTVVQDKPRLFLPTDPADCTERVLRRLQHNGREAVELLQSFQTPEPDDITLSLSSGTQTMAKARKSLRELEQSVAEEGDENEMEFEEGITFLMRHEDRKAQKEKGEP